MSALRSVLFCVVLIGCSGYRSSLKKGHGYLDSQRYSAAERQFDLALDQRTQDPEALLGLAHALIGQGNPERAIGPAQLALDAGLLGAQRVLIRARVDAGQGAAVLSAARDLVAAQPEDLTASSLLIEAALASDDLDTARVTADAMLARTSRGDARADLSASDLALLAWIQLRLGAQASAAALAVRASAMGMEDARVQAQAAAVFMAVGDTGSAQSAASTARNLASTQRQDWSREAARRDQGGDREGAIRLLSWHRVCWPQDGLTAARLGELWLAQRNFSAAQRELEAALLLPPLSAGAKISGVQIADRRSDGLSPDERRAARAVLYQTLSVLHLQKKNIPQAAQAAQHAIQLSRHATAADWLALADLWERAGNWSQVTQCALQILQLDERSLLAHHLASRAYRAQGDLAKAIGHGRIAWSLAPSNMEYALLLGGLHEQRSDSREARRIYTEALQRAPQDARLRKALQRVGG